MPSFLHSHLFHRSHSLSSLSRWQKSKSRSENSTKTSLLNRASSDMRESRPSSPLPPPSQPLPRPSTTAPSTPTPKAASTSDKEKDSKDSKDPALRPKHKRIFSLTRQTPEPVALNAPSPSDKEISSKNGKETEPPATMTSTSTTTTTSKSAPSSAAPNAASPAHAPTLALLNGEGTPSHKHSSSLPTSSILFTPPHPPVPAPSAGPALTKTPSPESQPPSARSSTIVVSPSLPSNLANLSVAEDVSRRSSFRHMFRRTSKDPKDKRTPKRHWGHHAKCPEKCADTHSSRDFSDGEDMSPTSLDSSIDYESAFRAVMLENMKLREEIVELRRRASLPVTTLTGTTLNGTINEHKLQDSYDVNTSAPSALGLKVHSGPPETLETSVRELTNAIRAVPGRILVIVLIAGFVSIIRSWKFDSCVYVV